jgi:hypothetical protein
MERKMSKQKPLRVKIWLLVAAILLCTSFLPGCSTSEEEAAEEAALPTPAAVPGDAADAADASVQVDKIDKWGLWSNGTQLRGANIYQRIVHPELDGTEFIGPGPVGPPYSQDDINLLAEMGANYVNISHPGLYRILPPYELDEGVQANLDRLLEMIAEADMFAVITFRTGPGRSEFSILRDGAGDWYDESYLIEEVWTDQAAQEAWSEMWRYTAERYRDNSIVVGYDLMCEPNANAIPDLWNPEEFQAEYGGSLYDWNLMYPGIVEAIREVDPSTPILIGANGYSEMYWLPYLRILDEERIVYTGHQYFPHPYTHQEPDWRGQVDYDYPGNFDADYDGEEEYVDREYLESWLFDIVQFQDENQLTIGINEYGLIRWVSGAADFLRDEISLFEDYGWNYAIWMWYPSWEPMAEGDNSFNFRLGPDPDQRDDLLSNELMEVITDFWSRNSIRPSSFEP